MLRNMYLEVIHFALTEKQKEAVLCMVVFFAGADTSVANSPTTEAIMMQTCEFLGIDWNRSNIEQILSRNNNDDALIETLKTITHLKTKEFLVLTCYDLASKTNDSNLVGTVYGIANDMGFNKQYVDKLIQMYS